MNQCLICDQRLEMKSSWRSLFLLIKEKKICEECEQQFKLLTGPICTVCGRMTEEPVCSDCSRWQNQPEWKDTLVCNRSTYEYNDFMKEVLAAFKYRGDAELVYVFKYAFENTFKKYFQENDMIVPIPSSKERLYERGFNQAKLLAECLDLSIYEPITRLHHEKQSKKSRQERIQTKNVFQMTSPSAISNQNILLIDDLYTTGTTLRHAAKILLEHGAKSVSSLTLIRS
ncbi:ComF family protein [Metabacillus arenae]|uniref:ComF family protein n=1 Tax=Metabacillus arenae TaxID=2771434 RepID=A0A926NDC3_9BACI|nr:ComF family protein [Metabacillus arenae]MBD1381389.1 ComF family protein [Metabacillus arenae]